MTGIAHRMSRLIEPSTGRALIVPVDDSLIAGPRAGLQDLDAKLRDIAAARPDAVLGFPGHFMHHGETLQNMGWICNLTASTVRSLHTRKIQVCTVNQAVALGCDAVAVHVNTTSRFENEMLETLGQVARAAQEQGVPVLAIMYPRGEGTDGIDNNYESERTSGVFAEMVCHAVRIARDLGATIVKTQYTGSRATFAEVVQAAHPLPVVIAGGALMNPQHLINTAVDALASGAAGLSFGRNIYSRPHSGRVVDILRRLVHENSSPEEALKDLLHERS